MATRTRRPRRLRHRSRNRYRFTLTPSTTAPPLPFREAKLADPPRVRVRRPAAGVLLRITDADGAWYLLGKRSRHLGGTWANFGGSLDPGEAPLTGALRELWEEIEMPASALAGAAIRAVVESNVRGSTELYTLFVIDVDPSVEHVLLDPDRHEVSEVTWWHADAISDLDLHSGFRAQWDAIRG